MTDPLLDSYWEAVRNEHYQAHLRRLPSRLERASRRRVAPLRVRRLAWALGAALVVLAAGFIPVPTAAPTGFLISGRTEARPVSETLRALESLPLPVGYNLSVSADSLGTAFSLFLPNGASAPVETWAERIEAAVAPTDLRVRTVDVVTDRALWVTFLDRVGVTIAASGATRAEVQAQVARQLEALGSGRADVERLTGPDGRETVRIIVRDLE